MNNNYDFITLESIDGGGKSTQINNIVKFFENKNKKCYINVEPGKTKLSKKIRELLLFSKEDNEELTEISKVALFLSSMNQSLEYNIKPKLKIGEVVVSDRFIDSTVAYQGCYSDQIYNKIYKMSEIMLDQDFKPTLTIILDLPVKISRDRVNKRDYLNKNTIKDNFESKKDEYFEKVRNAYLKIAKTDSKRYKVVDASKSIEEVSLQVEKILIDYYQKKYMNKNNNELIHCEFK